MKKILTLLTLIGLLLGLIPQSVFALNNTWYYVVTAYYSPLPDQNFYLTGNYTAEKRLNGEWIRWASWKKVFSWMLAWPKTYAFWTKIQLDWLGIWEIADRGGAIVTAWNRWYSNDRIDVWVWYWDEWLRRALYWGKRTIKGKIVSSNKAVTLNYNDISSPNWATSWLKWKNSVFTYPLWINSDKSKVKKLQWFFKDLGLYKWSIDWIYNDEIIDIVYDFQIENKLIKEWSLHWAWYWGNATRNKFKKAYLNWEFDKVEEVVEEKNSNVEVVTQQVKEEMIEDEKEIIDLSIFDKPVSWVDNIKILQAKLKELDIYNWDITWSYKDLIDPIYNFQIEKNIVTNASTPWAWSFWPKTRLALKNTYLSYLEQQKLLEEERVKEEKKKKEEEKRKKELEEKYKEIEKYAEEQASKKIDSIWYLKKWDISPNVRELQLTLKELGYFSDKDTAIFWPRTAKAVINLQIKNNIISWNNDIAAGIVWPKTLNVLKIELSNSYIEKKIEEENIDKDLLVSITNSI